MDGDKLRTNVHFMQSIDHFNLFAIQEINSIKHFDGVEIHTDRHKWVLRNIERLNGDNGVSSRMHRQHAKYDQSEYRSTCD